MSPRKLPSLPLIRTRWSPSHAGSFRSRSFRVAVTMEGNVRVTVSPYDARPISAYAFGARRATLVRWAARETSLATIGETFRLKTDGMM